ncbi:MAG: hypothetical protein VR66_08435 [Peptococcaceae bacterium BRH_c23]|nr:MAG: hypothetical protein VR66_08435 [Peptococcaceae bacterium BRH_c23]KJS89249.1 MAG: hypothetical protein JL57_08395 [Desulfosporosinus sp. BICA1-9]
MSLKFALVGNPNCGKTTLFNEITGSAQYVGNWPGVTIEKREGKANKFKEDIRIVDLPGIYSLSPYSMEEIISRDFIGLEWEIIYSHANRLRVQCPGNYECQNLRKRKGSTLNNYAHTLHVLVHGCLCND